VVIAALENRRKGFVPRRRLDEPGVVDARVKDSLSRFFYENIHRRPIIIPVVVEVGKTQRKPPS
jgi:mRNA degradation ribonuclease J1/J2